LYREEYNGVLTSINKTGEWELIRKGGILSDKGYFVPADRQQEEENGEAAEELFQARLKFSENSMLWEDPRNSIEFLKNEAKWTHLVGKSADPESEEPPAYKEEIDGTAEKTTRTYKSGMVISEDGAGDKMTITLASGTLIDVDGAGGVITIDADGGTNQIVINKSGEITIKASSKVNVEAPLVDVGEGAAFSSTLFENLLSEFAKHTHSIPGTAFAGPVPVAGVTSVPTAPLISLVGSQSVKVKD
jgi:hypothetical protein